MHLLFLQITQSTGQKEAAEREPERGQINVRDAQRK